MEGELPCIGLGLGLPSQTSCSVTVSGQQFPSSPISCVPSSSQTNSFLSQSHDPSILSHHQRRQPCGSPSDLIPTHRLDSLLLPPRSLRPRAPSALDDFLDEVAACRIPQGRLKSKTANVWLPKASAAQSGMSSSSLIPAHPTPLAFFKARRLVECRTYTMFSPSWMHDLRHHAWLLRMESCHHPFASRVMAP